MSSRPVRDSISKKARRVVFKKEPSSLFSELYMHGQTRACMLLTHMHQHAHIHTEGGRRERRRRGKREMGRERDYFSNKFVSRKF